jgi:nucleoside-diphosphate-sugar epimerase
MIKVKITGSNGFVGSNLIKNLTGKLYQVEGLNLRNNNWESEIDSEATTIIHLAGKAHDVKNTSNTKDYFDINTKLTKEIFDIFLNSNCRDFIFFSSVKAVTDKVDGTVTEETITQPKTVYGQSKLQAEQYILSKSLPLGKRVFIIRPSMIHGPGNKGNLNLLFQLVSKGFPWPLGNFENQRSFCSIDNLCFVLNEILQNENIPSGIYNIADDKPISTNELISLIAISQNKNENILRISKSLILSIAKLGDFFKLPFNSERLQKLTESYVVSNQKIVNVIGKPLPVKTEEGLLVTFKSFRK